MQQFHDHPVKMMSKEDYEKRNLDALAQVEHGQPNINYNEKILSDGSLNPDAEFANGETGTEQRQSSSELNGDDEY